MALPWKQRPAPREALPCRQRMLSSRDISYDRGTGTLPQMPLWKASPPQGGPCHLTIISPIISFAGLTVAGSLILRSDPDATPHFTPMTVGTNLAQGIGADTRRGLEDGLSITWNVHSETPPMLPRIEERKI
ncbi:hypothetical protein NEOLEDRAFT_1150770 [Neolentinus lepideus HHB14362 ss-1]|uniref:Uncharacterized protein n=1 Tax=Neolentinus lepideus HHB14362 ss-1 TaxID=1314782 RepID=A0A165PP35_9AGAM|nr:hypothetical protein NEOLEDRAFT_1150770 [Neolentinus lepideus HHB14362 ss-1]